MLENNDANLRGLTREIASRMPVSPRLSDATGRREDRGRPREGRDGAPESVTRRPLIQLFVMRREHKVVGAPQSCWLSAMRTKSNDEIGNLESETNKTLYKASSCLSHFFRLQGRITKFVTVSIICTSICRVEHDAHAPFQHLTSLFMALDIRGRPSHLFPDFSVLSFTPVRRGPNLSRPLFSPLAGLCGTRSGRHQLALLVRFDLTLDHGMAGNKLSTFRSTAV